MRVGIIGCGGISAVHAKSISRAENACLKAVADCVQEKARKLADQYGPAVTAYGDWEEMLEREALDVVHICTPHYLHTPMALKCLEKGIHVFTEKPPVISWGQLAILRQAVSEASAERGLHLGVCFQNRWNPEAQYAKKLLESGELGTITGARGFVTWRRDEAYYGDDWHGRAELEGGGALINQGIHTLDLIQFLTGQRAESVNAIRGNFHLQGVTEVEDTLCARIRYPGGAAVLYVTTGYAADTPPLIEIQCTEGRLRLEDGELTVWKGGKAAPQPFAQEEAYGKAYWGAGHQKAVSCFYESIRDNSTDLLDFQNVEDTLELFLRIYDAAGA